MQDLQSAQEEFKAQQNEQAARLKRAEDKAQELETKINASEDRSVKAEKSLVEKEAERQAAQNELDDLLMVFGDLEEKASKYKDRLKSLGEGVSDGEGEEDDEDEDEVD